MYSYIYADGRAIISYAAGSKTKDGIERIALDHIKNMIRGEIEYKTPSVFGADATQPPEVQNILDAVEAKDILKSIEAWNYYATTFMKLTITCHKIERFNIVE